MQIGVEDCFKEDQEKVWPAFYEKVTFSSVSDTNAIRTRIKKTNIAFVQNFPLFSKIVFILGSRCYKPLKIEFENKTIMICCWIVGSDLIYPRYSNSGACFLIYFLTFSRAVHFGSHSATGSVHCSVSPICSLDSAQIYCFVFLSLIAFVDVGWVTFSRNKFF